MRMHHHIILRHFLMFLINKVNATQANRVQKNKLSILHFIKASHSTTLHKLAQTALGGQTQLDRDFSLPNFLNLVF